MESELPAVEPNFSCCLYCNLMVQALPIAHELMKDSVVHKLSSCFTTKDCYIICNTAAGAAADPFNLPDSSFLFALIVNKVPGYLNSFVRVKVYPL